MSAYSGDMKTSRKRKVSLPTFSVMADGLRNVSNVARVKHYGIVAALAVEHALADPCAATSPSKRVPFYGCGGLSLLFSGEIPGDGHHFESEDWRHLLSARRQKALGERAPRSAARRHRNFRRKGIGRHLR